MQKKEIEKQAGPQKLKAFTILAIAFPFLLLFLLEMLLRLFGYGHNTDLFVKDPANPNYLEMNYYASDKFFSDTANATKGNHEHFAITKAPNTFRIFVLGESTTIGFPYMHNGAFHRWLQYRLMHMYPQKNFEVINLSLTAVNSYTVLDFGKQVIDYQPDAVMIYTGHNEYYGALGVGSTSYVGNSRWVVNFLVTLRELKIVQLLNNIISKITGIFRDQHKDDHQTLMKRMAARQEIIYGSADYEAGIKQFQLNMTDLCGAFSKAKIPVFLSTLVSNEKDLKPFISSTDNAKSANYFYTRGLAELQKGDSVSAKTDLVKAKELDELRFRAPEQINAIIKSLIKQFNNVHLVDTKRLFEQNSKYGILGKETLLEHVHPNLLGYSLMSEAFYRALDQQHLIKDKPQKEISFEELQAQMPVTPLDSLSGQYQIMMLKTGWPFNIPISKQFKLGSSIEERLAGKLALNHITWDAAMGQLYKYYNETGNKPAQLKVIEGMGLENPDNADFMNYAANINTQLKRYGDAGFYFEKLFVINPDPQTGKSIFQVYLLADMPQQAIRFVKYTTGTNPDAIKQTLEQIINDKQQLLAAPGNSDLKKRVAANYRTLGVEETAAKYSK